MPVPRFKASDHRRYIIFVLYLSGFTLTLIAQRVGLRVKQVAGIIARSEFTNRANMTIEERNAILLDLKEIRENPDGSMLDKGLLNDAAFVARPLKGRQNGAG